MSATVLIVDDSATIRQLVSSVLASAGWEVVTANNGRRALEVLAAAAVDLVITDWNMPDGSGLDLIKGIRKMEAHKGIPILVLSTETDPGCRTAAREAGATGWLGKPVDPVMLTNIARQLLDHYGRHAAQRTPE